MSYARRRLPSADYKLSFALFTRQIGGSGRVAWRLRRQSRSGFLVDDAAALCHARPMTAADQEGLRELAAQCMALVAADFGRHLDWSVASLSELDEVCAELLADGPLQGERLDLWWKLIGAYTGEVIVRAYDGQWITHEQAGGAYAVQALTVTGFPFALANRILTGEPYKSLASFARTLPAIIERTPPAD